MKKSEFPIKVGDLITAFRPGFHRCVGIKDRWYGIGHEKCYDGEEEPDGVEYSPLITYIPLYDERGEKVNKKKKELQCDCFYCKLAEPIIKKTIENLSNILK